MSISVAEKYIAAFGNLAKESNTILLPSNASDVGSMVAQVSHPHSFYLHNNIIIHDFLVFFSFSLPLYNLRHMIVINTG